MSSSGKGDPLIGDALQTILDRGDFIRTLADGASAAALPARPAAPAAPIATDPAIVAGLIARNEASVAALKRDIQTKSGPALLDFILEDIQAVLNDFLFELLNRQVIMAGMEAALVAERAPRGVAGGEDVADTLAQSAPGNVTSQHGLGVPGRGGRDPSIRRLWHFWRTSKTRVSRRAGPLRVAWKRAMPSRPTSIRSMMRCVGRDRHHEAAAE